MLSDADRLLLDGFQRDFPLTPTPFAALAARIGGEEAEVIARVARLIDLSLISRVGAVVRPNSVGASTLAALAAPPHRLEEIAEAINAEPGVNHNYEREHRVNLWFVVTGASRAAVAASLGRIEQRVGLPVMDLQLLRAFHIDLGFPLFGGHAERAAPPRFPPPPAPQDLLLLTAIEDGLPISRRPYRDVARRIGLSEADVIGGLRGMIDNGTIARFGLVVHHRRLGYQANAMVVWDIEEGALAEAGARLAATPSVTLCYERPRRPEWPYNLYSMVHGREREKVREEIARLAEGLGVFSRGHEILFSRRCFRQRGARLSAA